MPCTRRAAVALGRRARADAAKRTGAAASAHDARRRRRYCRRCISPTSTCGRTRFFRRTSLSRSRWSLRETFAFSGSRFLLERQLDRIRVLPGLWLFKGWRPAVPSLCTCRFPCPCSPRLRSRSGRRARLRPTATTTRSLPTLAPRLRLRLRLATLASCFPARSRLARRP